jgi:hypothetical protein
MAYAAVELKRERQTRLLIPKEIRTLISQAASLIIDLAIINNRDISGSENVKWPMYPAEDYPKIAETLENAGIDTSLLIHEDRISMAGIVAAVLLQKQKTKDMLSGSANDQLVIIEFIQAEVQKKVKSLDVS